VYRRGEGIVLFEPSVVAIDERTGEIHAVGTEARRMIGRTPAHISATRPLRDGVIADFEVTEQMLRHFIRKAAGKARSRADVMVCVPSGITQVERNAVTRAALAAGAAHAFLIEEPMAAAIGAGLPVAEPVGALVVDIGGGTTETAVTALGSLAVVHSIKVGGYQMDDAIVRSIQQRERLLIGQEQAEALKIEIGSATADTEAEREADVAGRDLTTGLLRRTSITAAQIRSALQRTTLRCPARSGRFRAGSRCGSPAIPQAMLERVLVRWPERLSPPAIDPAIVLRCERRPGEQL
jgi:rod shape-determining protein MreB and related proteins